MSLSLIAFTGFAIASAFTPGPNNIMLAAATASYGVRPVLPMLFGIQLGFCSMLLAMGFGLALPLMQYPILQSGLRWIGIAWLLYLAFKIATSPYRAVDRSDAKPALGFFGAALIQLLNPKAWLLCVAVATSWINVVEPVAPQVLATTLIFLLVGIPASSLWVGIGAGAARLVDTPTRQRIFNVVMALLLVASVLPLAFT
jgi:threonine/homoserine/homoserine lactone efflux protein